MVDISAKTKSLRIATAQAIVSTSSKKTINAIENNLVPKGNIFEMSKAAGLLAVKKTPDLLPDCHPIPIESTSVEYEIRGLDIEINISVKTIYKTGVEVEAMHGASVIALNIYDMLKPLDKGIEIKGIKLISKKGGKSDYRSHFKNPLKAAVIVCSDSISAGKKEDRAGKIIIEKLESLEIQVSSYQIIPDEINDIQNQLQLGAEGKLDLILFTGGTGLSNRDSTPEALIPKMERRIPGIEETIRAYGQERMPYSMLSRSVAGTYKNSLVLALPGSTNGAKESMDAIFPGVLHLFKIFKGARHDSPKNPYS
tara:strand:+ start:33453 stop:34385 length:933 start_codon:yes stop_codon:yes gene_type:complete